jgi:hypothetical protein
VIKYEFSAMLWQHNAPSGGWHFVSLPGELAKEIREFLKSEEEGWGRLRATVKVGNTEWKSAIWFDSKQNTYLLPIKAEIRKKEDLKVGDNVKTVVCL